MSQTLCVASDHPTTIASVVAPTTSVIETLMWISQVKVSGAPIDPFSPERFVLAEAQGRGVSIILQK